MMLVIHSIPIPPTCRLCFEDVPAKWLNTSNLLSHLKKHHLEEYVKVRASNKRVSDRRAKVAKEASSKQQTLEQCVAQTKKYSFTSKEHQQLTKSVALCIATDILPVYAVNKPGFRQMVQALNPRYDLPHREHFSRIALPSLYEETRQSLFKQLKDEYIYFSSTADMWSSNTSEPYIAYTIHYIDSCWSLQSHCIQAHYSPEDHTGQNLSDALGLVLQEWELDPSKQVAITTDSGSNIVLACRPLNWLRISCFGHNLDLAVRKGLCDERIDRVISLCKKVVSSFSSSWKRKRSTCHTGAEWCTYKKIKGRCQHTMGLNSCHDGTDN